MKLHPTKLCLALIALTLASSCVHVSHRRSPRRDQCSDVEVVRSGIHLAGAFLRFARAVSD